MNVAARVLEILLERSPHAAAPHAYTFEWCKNARVYSWCGEDAFPCAWRYDSPRVAVEALANENLWPWEVDGDGAARWLCGRCAGLSRTGVPCAVCGGRGHVASPASWERLVTMAVRGPALLKTLEREWAEVAPRGAARPVWEVLPRDVIQSRVLDWINSSHLTWAKIHAVVNWWATLRGVPEDSWPELSPVVWDPPGGPSAAEEAAAYRAMRVLWRRGLYLSQYETPPAPRYLYENIPWGLLDPAVLLMPSVKRVAVR